MSQEATGYKFEIVTFDEILDYKKVVENAGGVALSLGNMNPDVAIIDPIGRRSDTRAVLYQYVDPVNRMAEAITDLSYVGAMRRDGLRRKNFDIAPRRLLLGDIVLLRSPDGYDFTNLRPIARIETK